MILDILLIVLSLAFILISCFVFTNSVEWLGKKLNLSEGVVGSIFSAIGTALPETIIPIISILFYTGENAHEIGIGSIAGAPFMLSTLAFFVTGAAVFIFSSLKKRTLAMNVEVGSFSKDLTFFIVIYGAAVLISFTHIYPLKIVISVILMLSYIYYIKMTFSKECSQCENSEDFYLSKIFKVKASLFWIVFELLLALLGIVLGADFFVQNVESFSSIIGVSPLILSIIITPIATELPEKINSVIWVSRNKDTLALGNITGSMVFQSCFPVVFGILFTPWNLTGITMVSAILALSSSALNLIWVKVRKTVSPFVLMFGGVLYVIFLFIAIM